MPSSTSNLILFLILIKISHSAAGKIPLGSELSARTGESWVSENGTFAFGFAAVNSDGDLFLLGIWYARLPNDQNAVVWSPNRDTPVSKEATVKLDQTGNLLLLNKTTIIWSSNTSSLNIQFAFFSDSGNFILSTAGDSPQPIWQSFSHPSDTLLPGQPLTSSLELTSSKSPSGYYSLKMLQQETSLSLALTYSPLLQPNNNYSYWASPQISNATGEVIAILDSSGNFAIMYGKSAAGTVYVHKNDSGSSAGSLRRITIGVDGNVRLYQWNGSDVWVSLWAAVSNPCQVAGICGGDICVLDGNSSWGASCRRLPKVESGDSCKGEKKKMEMIQQTSYYFTGASTIANYSDLGAEKECADHCEVDCECVASVYEIVEGENYCSVLSSMLFGGLQDPTSTLYIKVGMNETMGESDDGGGSKDHHIEIVLPLVLCFSVLTVLLCLFLGFTIKRRKNLGEQMMSTYLTLPGAPLNFTYHDLQMATSNFSRFLGAGGFGSVYKGVLRDGTQIAVKKLERLLPHGEREFVTEVTTIGSMHHMNLVNLCGFCSERSHRLLVYEYMSNGSLDKWIFPSNNSQQNKFLEWKTRVQIAFSIAQGIAYFHEQCKNRIIHCDIKPENILLDENFCPKVSDFGLAKLMSREHSHVITMVRGTRGYLAPEWVSNRPITVKADVYSFGMVLLEIIGGRRNLDVSLDEEQFFYPRLVFKEMTKETPMRAVDKRLKPETVDSEELVRALRTAFWCIQEDVAARPSMGEVVRMLEGSVEINPPPMPQSVLELVEEGLHQKRGFLFEPFSSSSAVQSHGGVSQETGSQSTMSPR